MSGGQRLILAIVFVWGLVMSLICVNARGDVMTLHWEEVPQSGARFEAEFIYEPTGRVALASGLWQFGASNNGLFFWDDSIVGQVDPNAMTFDVTIDRSLCCWSVGGSHDNQELAAFEDSFVNRFGITDFEFDSVRLWQDGPGLELQYEITDHEWDLIAGQRVKRTDVRGGSLSGQQVSFLVPEPAGSKIFWSVLGALFVYWLVFGEGSRVR